MIKKITEGKEQPPIGKAVTDTDVQKSLQSLAGIYDPKLKAEAKRLQDDASTTVLIADNVPQFQPAKINTIDPNSSMAMELNNKTYPGQQFDKRPTKIVQGLHSPAQKDPYHHSTQGY